MVSRRRQLAEFQAMCFFIGKHVVISILWGNGNRTWTKVGFPTNLAQMHLHQQSFWKRAYKTTQSACVCTSQKMNLSLPLEGTRVADQWSHITHLTVESEEPVTMTRSSYWRQRTEPVWPVNTFKHSKLVLSQIYWDKTNHSDLVFHVLIHVWLTLFSES